MADRISALEAERASLESALATSGKSTTKSIEPTTDHPGVAQLRLDLAEALRSKGVAETRLRTSEEELIKLRSRTKGDSKSIRDLTSERTMITTRLKDREYELREKRKLIEVPETCHQTSSSY